MALIETGQELPPDLDREPTLAPEWQFYYNAFTDLWQFRQPQHNLDYLPWEVLNSYAIRYHLDNADFEVFVEMIRALETTFLQSKFFQEPGTKEEE